MAKKGKNSRKKRKKALPDRSVALTREDLASILQEHETPIEPQPDPVTNPQVIERLESVEVRQEQMHAEMIRTLKKITGAAGRLKQLQEEADYDPDSTDGPPVEVALTPTDESQNGLETDQAYAIRRITELGGRPNGG